MNENKKTTSKDNGTKRLWIPVVVMFSYCAAVAWLTWTESMFRNSAVLALGLLAVLLIWIWWTFASGLKRAAMGWSLGLGVACIGGVALILAKWVRYEGSADGSALPKLAWVWTATTDQRLEQSGAPQLEDRAAPESRDITEIPGLHLGSPQYLGPQRNGRIDGVTLASNWDARPPERLWSQPIGLGWSGFAVLGMRAVTQEQRGEEEWVSCYDLGNGKLLWVHSDRARFSEAMGSDGPRATPTISGARVVTMGATGILNCLNLKDGTLIWTRDVLTEHKQRNLEWGKAASPLILESEGLVVVTAGREGTPTVLTYRLDSGEPNWSWGGDAASYCSPIEASLLGVRQVISVNENTIVGLEPESGKELWVHRWPRGISDSTAKSGQPQIVGENRILLTASYGVGSLLIELSRDEQGAWKTSEAWRSKASMKTKFSSACVKENYAYGIDEGVFACQDLATGRRVWKGGRYGYGQNLLVGDHLLIQAENGSVVLVAADPAEHRELARFPALTGKTWNVPTLAGQFLLVRNDTEAACFRLPLEKTLVAE
ncbi:MAG: PQQ-binding-like beta-propeller repeat protein [Verrucomicrobia bacterium]|nr:PQQ-binding-like beta-propeller repeat protein [Verrucomicrobiota bacterium]